MQNENVAVWLPKELVRRVESIARVEDRSRTGQIRWFVDRGCREHERTERQVEAS